LDVAIAFETLNVKLKAKGEGLNLISDAGRGLQPRSKRLDVAIAFETLNVKLKAKGEGLNLISAPP
jgi:hypothetical protein